MAAKSQLESVFHPAGSKDEDESSLNEEEDAKEGVALMEGALEELEQARDLLTSMEQKVRDCSPCSARLLSGDVMLHHAGDDEQLQQKLGSCKFFSFYIVQAIMHLKHACTCRLAVWEGLM